MLSIEQALDLYTDKLTSHEVIKMAEFKSQMTPDAFAEFEDLLPMIDALVANNRQAKFDKLWETMNHPAETEAADILPMASGFRTNGDIDEAAALKKLDEIFKAEFGDDV